MRNAHPIDLVPLLRLLLIVCFAVGSYLFGFLVVRWVVHARSDAACRDDYTGGVLSLIVLGGMIFCVPAVDPPYDYEYVVWDIALAPAFGTLVFLAGLGTVRLWRRLFHRPGPASPEVRAARRRLCAAGLALTALLIFGVERLLDPLLY